MVEQRRLLDGTLLWEPSTERIARANLTRYRAWLSQHRGLNFDSYQALWEWSVTDLQGFWGSVWDYFELGERVPGSAVLLNEQMPGASWFPGAQLNFADLALRRRDAHPAIIFASEEHEPSSMSFAELARAVASAAAGLRRLGVQRGDRVAALLSNRPEAVIALLATASIGAIWSCCPPEFGPPSVIDRFRQIDPRVLIAAPGYRYNGKQYDRHSEVAEIRHALSGLAATIFTDDAPRDAWDDGLHTSISWQELTSQPAALEIEPLPFDQPLWLLYSSGTTGLPKAIVQGHGGIILEQMKALAFHLDLGPDDRYFWFTTTGWMMWNKLISGLLLGATVVLYDGSPSHPNLEALWRLAEKTQLTFFGVGAPFLQACQRAGIEPARRFDLSSVLTIGSTGAPLPAETFQWVYEHVKADVLLGPGSGGTDVCTAFVGSCPILAVHAGEMQCRALGAAVEVFDEAGRSVVDQMGELVVTRPLPSMPLFLWNDPHGSRYQESYFDTYPGVWRHGDWLRITPGGACVIYGRSDATLNRGGVRMGSGEFYRVVESLPEIADSLVVDTSQLGSDGQLLLFVVLTPGSVLDDPLRERINRTIRAELSPRHLPNAIYQVGEIPRTLNAKKIEVPIKRILNGVALEAAISADALANPRSLDYFVELARKRASAERGSQIRGGKVDGDFSG